MPNQLAWPMKILVTGADGFIGSHLVQELVAKGHRVTALSQYNSFNLHGWLDFLPPKTREKIALVTGDIRDAAFISETVKGHDRVAHLAALIAIPYSYSAPASYLETNAFGTLNVLEACRVHEIERLIHTSTSEVYGSAQYVPIDEKHPIVGQSPYSASKIAGDQLAYSYWSSFSVPVTTIRPFNAYGPRQSQRAFIPSVIVQLLGGLPEIRLGSLEPTRDLTFVKDTVRGFVLAIESDRGVGETFNMGTGFEVSMRKVVEMLCEISGQSPVVISDSDRIRPESSEVVRLCSDSSRMAQTFGWEPVFADRQGLFQGLEATYDWYRANQTITGFDATKFVV